MPTTFNWIYLGKAADIDTAEGNTNAENAGALVGTSFGSAGTPLYSRITSVTTRDTNGDGALNQNANVASETFTTDIGSGPQTLTFDAAIQCNVTLTYADGTTGTGTMVLAQDTAGNLFLAPQRVADATSAAQEAKPILSLRVTSVAATDFLGLATDRPMTGWDNGIVDGTSGGDLIDGSYAEPVANGSDRVDGGDGTSGAGTGWNDDSIRAGAGSDTVRAGLGNDTVDGGTEADSIDGGTGNDSLLGGAGTFSDTLIGGLGDDTLRGGDGADQLFGGDGNDSLDGGLGNDAIDGGIGNDSVLAGDGNDSVTGGAGHDTIFGGAGADVIDGGTEADSLDGGSGDDRLNGGAGGDTMAGGLGSDLFTGLGIGDHVDGSEDAPSTENDVLDLFGSGWTKDTTNILYAGGNNEAGTVQFLDAGGNVIGTMTFSNIETVVPCFTPGTMVDTLAGPMAVEHLREGDLVLTRDSGYRPIRWAGRRDLIGADILRCPRLAPVRIAAGALGPCCPARDMRVSPQHRMLITGAGPELIAGEAEVLVAALHLVGRAGVTRDRDGPVSYIHLLFDDHEIIRAEGAWSESFQPGAMVLDGMEAAQRAEILTLFPELAAGVAIPAARATLGPHEARLIGPALWPDAA